MGIEYRNGKPYYYHKKRQGDKVISEYVGIGEMAYIYAELAQDTEASKREKQQENRKQRERHGKEDAELVNLEQTLDALFTAVALILYDYLTYSKVIYLAIRTIPGEV